jgi:hypothetical protein
VGDIFSFGDISDGAETETDLVAAHSHGYPLPVERALFALAMCPWEEFVEDEGISWWRPFIVKWVHEVPHDPLARIYALPSADSLSWRINWSVDSKSGQERQYEIPMQMDYNPKGMATIAGDLSGIWKGIDAVWPVQRAAHPAFNSLVPHFILEAFRATGIDQLIFHNTAIDAALFTQGQGAKRDAGKSIATLLNKKAADSYFDLYDARSDYIHGRAFKRPLTYADLRAMRRVSRQVILRVLDLLRAHPEWTRRNYMNHLESLES